MAYTPTNWKDRVVEKPRTYRMQDNGDGTITLIPEPGTIYELGTPVNAANLNKLENGLQAAAAVADAALPKSGGTMTGPIETRAAQFMKSKYANMLTWVIRRMASDATGIAITPSSTNEGEDWNYSKEIRLIPGGLLIGDKSVWAEDRLRWNASGYLEYNDGGVWRPVSATRMAVFGVGTHTWTVPPGVNGVYITACGGGGGGAGGGSMSSGAGGGGAACIIHQFFLVTPGADIHITVGAGGTGGAPATPGTAGGATIISGLVTLPGGGAGGAGGAAGGVGGGDGGVAGRAGEGGAGGTGGTSSSGGGGGGGGSYGGGGGGGSSIGAGGAGGSPVYTSYSSGGTGNNGNDIHGGNGAYGGGGGGGAGGVGGNGGPGIVIIEW